MIEYKKCHICKHFFYDTFCSYNSCNCKIYGSLDCDQKERHPDTEADKCKNYEPDDFKQLDEALELAFAEFKKEYGEDVKFEDGEEFVTIFNNAVLVVGMEGTTLKTKFIGGKPYRVDMTLEIYEGGSDDE